MAKTRPKEQIFRSVTYDKVNVIRELLRFYHVLKIRAIEDFNEEIICIYLDLDRALDNIYTTARQKEALSLYMAGWTEKEIGVLLGGISHQAVHKLVRKVCCKVSEYLTQGVANSCSNRGYYIEVLRRGENV